MSKTNLPGRLLRDQRGATAIEYGLVLAMITLAVMGALTGFAREALRLWNTIETESTEAISGS